MCSFSKTTVVGLIRKIVTSPTFDQFYSTRHKFLLVEEASNLVRNQVVPPELTLLLH